MSWLQSTLLTPNKSRQSYVVGQPNRSRLREQRRGIWQRRYWEHTIADETDLENHFDYIHYNPVKHQLVRRPRDWPATTFHRDVVSGHYDLDWGAGFVEPKVPGDAGKWLSSVVASQSPTSVRYGVPYLTYRTA